MRWWRPFVAGLLIGSALVLVCGGSLMERQARFKAERQLSINSYTCAWYSLQARDLPPQMKEYLKAQLYYYARMSETPLFRLIPQADLGEVREDLLGKTVPFLLHADGPND